MCFKKDVQYGAKRFAPMVPNICTHCQHICTNSTKQFTLIMPRDLHKWCQIFALIAKIFAIYTYGAKRFAQMVPRKLRQRCQDEETQQVAELWHGCKFLPRVKIATTISAISGITTIPTIAALSLLTILALTLVRKSPIFLSQVEFNVVGAL